MPEKLTRRDLLRSGGLALVAATAIGSSALAQDAKFQTVLMEPDNADSLFKATHELIDYSKQSGGVGILLSYKAWENGHSAEDIAAAFIGKFNTNGTEADYRVVENDVEGASVIFVVQDTAQGPYTPNEAWAMVPDIAEQNRAARQVLTSDLSADLN